MVTAVKQLLYVLKQCEKIMPPPSYNMMKKAVFTVCRNSWRLCVVRVLADGEEPAVGADSRGKGRCVGVT